MRSLTAGAITTLQGTHVPMVMLTEMMMSAPVRLATSAVDITYGGNTYVGAGSLGTVERINDAPGDAKPLRFSVSGVPTETMAIALQEQFRDDPCTLRLAILDPVTHALQDAPIVWDGTLDQMPVSQSTDNEGRSSASISVTAEHRGATYERPKPLRYTNGDQSRLFAGDTSLRFVVSQAAHQDIWPSANFFRK